MNHPYMPQQNPTPIAPPQSRQQASGNWNPNPNQRTPMQTPSSQDAASVGGWPQAVAANPNQETMNPNVGWSEPSAAAQQQFVVSPQQALTMQPGVAITNQPPMRQRGVFPAQQPQTPNGYMAPPIQASDDSEALLLELPDLTVGLAYLAHRTQRSKTLQTYKGTFVLDENGVCVVDTETAQEIIKAWPSDFLVREGAGQQHNPYLQPPMTAEASAAPAEPNEAASAQVLRLVKHAEEQGVLLQQAQADLAAVKPFLARQDVIVLAKALAKAPPEITELLDALLSLATVEKKPLAAVALLWKSYEDKIKQPMPKELVEALDLAGIEFESEATLVESKPKTKPKASPQAKKPAGKTAKPTQKRSK